MLSTNGRKAILEQSEMMTCGQMNTQLRIRQVIRKSSLQEVGRACDYEMMPSL